MIITIFHTDGSKERRPLGYGGGLCHAATAPYEKYDVPGTITTTPTNEAYEQPVVSTTGETERLKQGN
jgi:hypothetical protein